MKTEGVVASVLVLGVLMGLLWLAFWGIFIPQNAPALAWSGYEAFTPYVVITTWLVAAPLALYDHLSKR